MSAETPLVDGKYRLRKFEGKGGWTYAEIPEISQNPENPFGWVTVRGSIDGFELSHFKLMPMGDGKLFLPVKKAIRQKIKKEAGDTVRIVLDLDETPVNIPDEIMACFENEDRSVYDEFMSRSDSERKAFLDWIYAARSEDTKARRILTMMDKLSEKLSFYERQNPSDHVD